jgi:hypothetical protein
LQIFTKISGLHKKDQKGARTVMSSTCKPAVLQSDQEEQEKAERRIIGLDRRQFSYSAYIPERRSGQNRRKEAEAGKCPDGLSSQNIDE